MVDFKTAAEAGFHQGTPNPEVLKIAAEEGRIVISHDQRTLPWHFGSFIESQTSPGVVIITQSLSIADAAQWLHLIWEAATPVEYRNRIEIISQPF